MTNYPTRLQYLYLRFIRDEASADEVREFWELMKLADKNDPVKESVFELYGDQVPEEIERKDWGESFRRIVNQPEKVSGKLIYRWWAAAASVILLVGAFSYFYFGIKKEVSPEVPPAIVKTAPHDIAPPGSSRATITLANGQKIFLDSTANGVLAMQDNVELKKQKTGKLFMAAQPQM